MYYPPPVHRRCTMWHVGRNVGTHRRGRRAKLLLSAVMLDTHCVSCKLSLSPTQYTAVQGVFTEKLA